MHRMRFLVLGVVVASAACATSSKLVGTWQNDSYDQRRLRKVLVIANTPDLRVRQMAEREFVRQFEEHEVRALPSFEILGTQTEINRANVEKAVQDTDIDAVFAIGIVGEHNEDREVPGVTHQYNEPPRYYYNFYDYNERSSTTISTPGYTTTSKVYVLESNLYDSGSADLMWTATTQTTDPRSAEEALPPLARVLMKTLDRAGFFR